MPKRLLIIPLPCLIITVDDLESAELLRGSFVALSEKEKGK